MTISLSELAEKIALAATYSSLGEVVISEEEADAVVAALRELAMLRPRLSAHGYKPTDCSCDRCQAAAATDAALAGVGGKGTT